MSVYVIYKPVSEHARPVEEYLYEFEKRTGHKLNVVNPDERHGAEFCGVYDVVEYPSVIAVASDGQLMQTWRGLPMPLIDEVNSYV